MKGIENLEKNMRKKEKEGFNCMIQMALSLKQQINIRKSYLKELDNKHH